MKKIAVVVGGMATAVTAHAAGLYGSVTVDGRLATATVEIVCGGQVIATAQSDARGSYRVGIDRPGRDCEARIDGASTPVVLYPAPTRYDFALTHQGGRSILARR